MPVLGTQEPWLLPLGTWGRARVPPGSQRSMASPAPPPPMSL